MYSAVKYRGQRLYRLARQGKTVPRQARDIFVRRVELLDQRATQITLSITCSKGTYIRTLGEDIGLALGCGAHVLHLQRCRVGNSR
jgi:tRNA pseudouridine55 synthase